MMFSQVYFHPARLMYDAHLQDFLAEWLPGGRFSTDLLAKWTASCLSSERGQSWPSVTSPT